MPEQSTMVCLNDELLVGPDLLNNVCGVLLRFREERVPIAADIESTFHQCLIMEQDQPALRFLWRNLETNCDPDIYQMLVMIFGAASSPCTANYVLRKTTDENCEDPLFSPETIEAVKSHFLRISRIERHSQKNRIFFYFAKTSLWVS